ncbi:hypothetical protein [Parasphingorhabdus sp.]|uniref:hypothetical protein n=1 Tax=Parasphingorhabdus sp. TaxID=2709688 RepID=UPI003D2BBB31
MTPTDLSREIELAVKAVQNRHLGRLQALGVDSATIARLGAIQPPFGVMDCEDIGGRIYQPGGEKANIVQPVYDGGILIDIVAWRTTEPQKWLWRTGAAWALNMDTIAANSWQDEPLVIDATPLDWLRGGATGLCILNWDAPEIRTLLRVQSISAEALIARQLRGILMKPLYFPEISARSEHRNAA